MSARDQYARRDRINDMIRISPVRLIGPDNEQLGVVPLDEAKRMAYDQNLDLVEIVADSRPPVCKVMDYGRYKYEQSKKDKRAPGSKKSELKEVRLGRSLKIDPHDVEMRVNQARAFILQGHKVQFLQPMRGREFQYRDQGLARMKEIEQTLSDIAKVEVPPRFTGRMIMMIVVGDRSKIHAIRKAEEKAKEKAEEKEKAKAEEKAAEKAKAKAKEEETVGNREEESPTPQPASRPQE